MRKNLTHPHFVLAVVAIAALAVSAAGADSTPTVTLRSQRKVGQTDRVTVLLEAEGDCKEKADGKQQRMPMSGVDKLTYQEMTLAVAPAQPRAVRFYEKAEAVTKFKEGEHTPSLGEKRRLVVAAAQLPTVTLFSPQGPLTWEELGVIDILGNSLLLDQLLPEGAVSVGQQWHPDEKVAAALFGLDSAKRCELQCTLKEVTDTVARVEFDGRVEGPVNDTSASIQVKGKYRFDLRTNRIDWFALVTKEDRGISQVAAGFDIVVRLQMTIAPHKPGEELSETGLKGLNLEPAPETTRLTFESPQDRWRISFDRCWHLNSDARDRAVLKLMHQGTFTGQCTISTLPRRDPNRLVSLEEFQDDVRKALDKSFGEFVEATQSVDQANHRVLRVVVNGAARGKATEVPYRWIYYHVANRDGQQAALVFTVEQELAERFADADKPLVGSLIFAESGGK